MCQHFRGSVISLKDKAITGQAYGEAAVIHLYIYAIG